MINQQAEEANTTQVKANTMRQQAETIRVLVDVGYDKETATTAVTANDLSKLNKS